MLQNLYLIFFGWMPYILKRKLCLFYIMHRSKTFLLRSKISSEIFRKRIGWQAVPEGDTFSSQGFPIFFYHPELYKIIGNQRWHMLLKASFPLKCISVLYTSIKLIGQQWVPHLPLYLGKKIMQALKKIHASMLREQ